MTNPYGPPDAGARVQESAREWNKIQVAVLSFVGLCGLLGGDSGAPPPLWVQDARGVAALAGLVLALTAVVLVASAAFPPVGALVDPRAAARRLRIGIAVTFVAVACTALAALTGWWPDRGETQDGPPTRPVGQVAVTTTTGSACGTILDSASGVMDLDVDGQRVRVPLDRLVSISSVADC
ncbi:hypothetical protein [Mycolicibacterium sp.]|uniref:hypothetical protein n=1 Tax=Mycolicibacterium sp. TaxID=2320850 RepID=UPI003D11D302